jgi:hypothetical protein
MSLLRTAVDGAVPTDGAALMPTRIQRRRSKGWRMPEGVVYVGRGSKWGNPFEVGVHGTREQVMKLYVALCAGLLNVSQDVAHVESQQKSMRVIDVDLHELRGRDLACWCPVSAPCHADVLMALANNQPIPDAWKPAMSRIN